MPFAKACKLKLLCHNQHLCPLRTSSSLYSYILSAQSLNASICDSWFRMPFPLPPQISSFSWICVSFKCSLAVGIHLMTVYEPTNTEKKNPTRRLQLQHGLKNHCFPHLFCEAWLSTCFTDHFKHPKWGIWFKRGGVWSCGEVECSMEVGRNSGRWLEDRNTDTWRNGHVPWEPKMRPWRNPCGDLLCTINS